MVQANPSGNSPHSSQPRDHPEERFHRQKTAARGTYAATSQLQNAR